jgi:hypothetical protein
MTFQVTRDGAKVVVPFVGFGRRWTVTLWFQKVGFDESDMVALADSVQYAFYTAFDNKFSDALQYGPPVVYDMRTVDGTIATGTDNPEGGEASADALPLQTAAVLTLRTNKRGRAHRGRLYIAGFTEAEMADNAFSESIRTAMNNFGDALTGVVGPIGWTWGVRSGTLDGVKREEAIITPISSYEMRNLQPGSQRRRTGRA